MTLKIFVSYSHKDTWARDELLEHIGYLRHSVKISVFSDKDVNYLSATLRPFDRAAPAV